MTTAKRFKVLGVNDDDDTCECCGKKGLKKVVWIEDTETGSVQHFGLICAANPAKAFNLGSEIKTAQNDWKNERDSMWRLAHSLYHKSGGKYVSNGIPLYEKGGGLKPANESAFADCKAQALTQMKAARQQFGQTANR